MEMFIMIDALRRQAPRRITAVIPFYGYAQDRKRSTARPDHGQARGEPS
jgi:phosphoribosylpyrophosphate synthetase